MKTLSARDSKHVFGRLIDLDRAKPVAVAKHGWPDVVVRAMEEHERLRVSRGRPRQQPSKQNRESRMMDKTIHSKIVSFISSIEANFGSHSHSTTKGRAHSTDAKRSESP